MNGAERDGADIAQGGQFAAEIDAEIGTARIVLATLANRPQTVRTRHQINVLRHELAALQFFRYRIGDRFGI